MRFLATFLLACLIFAPGCGPAAAAPPVTSGGARTGAGSDTTAIHKATAGEIATASACTVAAGDYFLGEDVSAANAKCRTTAGAIAAIGTVLIADTSTAAYQFVIDEDSFATNSATKVPTQQSTKAYVDAAVTAGGSAPTTDSTLATCQGLTPAESAVCYPTDAMHLTMLARSAGTWSYLMPMSGGDVTLPPTASWSWDNQVSATVAETGGRLTIYTPADAGFSIHSRVRTAPATPWTLRIVVVGWNANNRVFGLILRESGTGELYMLGQGINAEGLSVHHYAGPTAGTTTLRNGQGIYAPPGNVLELYVTDNGTNLIFGQTMPGGTDLELYTVARTTHMAAGPDQFGFGVSSSTTPGAIDLYSWLVQ